MPLARLRHALLVRDVSPMHVAAINKVDLVGELAERVWGEAGLLKDGQIRRFKALEEKAWVSE